MKVRSQVREALNAALQHGTTGFNAKLAAVAASNSITAYIIDWSGTSKQFLQGYLDPGAVDLSGVITFPALVLYTTGAQSQDGREKFRTFTGDVTAQLDYYVEFRQGIEQGNIEKHGEAIEDALLEVLAASHGIFQSAGVTWAGDIGIEPSPVVQLTDGWLQRFSFTLTFERAV